MKKGDIMPLPGIMGDKSVDGRWEAKMNGKDVINRESQNIPLPDKSP